jgi:lactobin A/cerein 7B family class IIb bacteriocin
MNLKNLNVQEMNMNEMVEIEGGIAPLVAWLCVALILGAAGTLH